MLAAILVLTLAVFAQERRDDGGVWGDPHRDPRSVTVSQVDTLMWPIVERINSSGWAWTTESCQGHVDTKQPPTLGIVTHDGEKVLGILAASVLAEGSPARDTDTAEDPGGLMPLLGFFPASRHPRLGSLQVRIVFQTTDYDAARRVFTDMARRIAP